MWTGNTCSGIWCSNAQQGCISIDHLDRLLIVDDHIIPIHTVGSKITIDRTDDKLDSGMTIDEVFEELGEASALTEEYNDIGMRQQTKEYV